MTFTFDNESAYQSAKASGGSVYNAVYASSDYSAAAVSYIAATGKTLTDAKNVIVPREKGRVGDALLYHASSGVFSWCKSLAGWSASSLGQTMGREDQLNSAGYTVVGFCARRKGRECLIISKADGSSSAAWSSNTSGLISGVWTSTSILRADGALTWIAPANSWLPERTYGSGYYVYTWPISRSVWEAACAAELAGSGSLSGTPSYTIGSDGKVVITSTGTDGSFSVKPADWGYDFDRWYDANIRVRRPAASGVLSQSNGRVNTYKIPGGAAAVCKSWAVSGAPGFTAGNWYLGSTDEMCDVADATRVLNAHGASLAYDAYWTSDQYSATYAWYVDLSIGRVYFYSKTYGLRVRPVSAFTI